MENNVFDHDKINEQIKKIKESSGPHAMEKAIQDYIEKGGKIDIIADQELLDELKKYKGGPITGYVVGTHGTGEEGTVPPFDEIPGIKHVDPPASKITGYFIPENPGELLPEIKAQYIGTRGEHADFEELEKAFENPDKPGIDGQEFKLKFENKWLGTDKDEQGFKYDTTGKHTEPGADSTTGTGGEEAQ